jgi:HrpA-like RNA helicase
VLTELGRAMAALPISPRHSRMLLAAAASPVRGGAVQVDTWLESAWFQPLSFYRVKNWFQSLFFKFNLYRYSAVVSPPPSPPPPRSASTARSCTATQKRTRRRRR